MQSLLLKAKGLYTFPNILSEVPEGALTTADNVTIDRNGIIEPRRGFAQYGTEFGISTDRAKQLIVYKDRILRHYTTVLQYDDGSGTFSSFNGSYSETETGLRLKSIEANGNLYFTTSTGVKRLSASAASEFTTAAGYIRNAGGVDALDVTGVANYATAGFFINPDTSPAYAKVAYRITWAFRDANDNLIEGAPSSRLVVTNYSAADSSTIDLTFAIPSDISATDTQFFYRIYRTAVIGAATVDALDEADPGEEMNLVIEDYPTSAQLTARSVTVNDLTPEDYREGGALLYTNPVSGDGILQANYVPPIAKDVALFQNTAFYANTQTAQQLDLALLGVTDLTSGTSTLTITQGATTNTYTFRGVKEVSVFTFDTQANTNDSGYCVANSASNLRKYFFWMNKSGTTPEPLGPDTAGRIPVECDISASVTADDVAEVFTVAVNTTVDFTAIRVGNVVTVTNVNNGNATNAADGDSVTGSSAPGLVDEATDTITITAHGLSSGQRVEYNSTVADITGLTSGSLYFVRNVTANTFQLSSTAAGAIIDLTDDGTGDHTFSSGLGGSFSVGTPTEGDGEDLAALDVLLSALVSPSQAIDETARSLVNIINNNTNEIVNAYYMSGPDDTPGLILLKARSLSGAAFTVIANSTATGGMFSPALPTSGSTVISDNEVEENGLFYSKYQQPDAVPIVNKFNVGPKDKAILRVLPLRDSLFVLKEDGIYRITGQAGSFTLDPFDYSAICLAPDSAVVLNNQIYCLSSQGIITISDTGVSVISRPIEGTLDRVTSSNYSYRLTTFGVAYESDRAYLLWMVNATSDTVATQCFRFNTFTSSWTRFPISKSCGVVNITDDKLYLGAGDENFIERERKAFLRTDYADREFTLSVPVNGVFYDDNEVELSSLGDVEDGDVLVQTQYLTISQFNQMLRKLDIDIGVTDADYESLLEAEPGENMRNALDALATKLDADAGVACGGFSALMGASTAFVDIQTDFNDIVTRLNTVSGVFHKNFRSSTGTISVETIIIDADGDNLNSVEVEFNVPFIQGTITLFKGIAADIIWAPQSFGDPSIMKQVREGTVLFEDNVFYTAEVGYASDLSPNFEFIEFDAAGVGDWGGFYWGSQNWGGEGSAVPFRTYIPRYKQRCRFLKPRFRHSSAREKFAVLGISLTFRPIGERAYRE